MSTLKNQNIWLHGLCVASNVFHRTNECRLLLYIYSVFDPKLAVAHTQGGLKKMICLGTWVTTFLLTVGDTIWFCTGQLK